MFLWLRYLIGWVVSALSSRRGLILENLALRQQLLSLHAKRPRHRLSATHKLFWVLLRRLWSGWKTPLVLVTPPPTCLALESHFQYKRKPARCHSTTVRTKARGRGDSGSDLSY